MDDAGIELAVLLYIAMGPKGLAIFAVVVVLAVVAGMGGRGA